MEINKLINVLDYVKTTLSKHGVLAAYERLIVALEEAHGGAADAAQLVQVRREEVITIHNALDSTLFGNDEKLVLEQYQARQLLGQPVIERLNNAFVENFMHPEQVVDAVRGLHTETNELLERIEQVMVSLEPVLSHMPTVDGEFVDAEIVEPYEMMDSAEKSGLVSNIRNRFNRQSSGTSLVPHDQTPLSAKVMAAMPIALAAAGKALEIYLDYSSKKNSLAKVPNTSNHPIVPAGNKTPPAVTNFVRYTVNQTIVQVRGQQVNIHNRRNN